MPDCVAAETLLDCLPAAKIPNGDKGYDSNKVRSKVQGMGTVPNIPPKKNRRWKNCFSPFLYRDRNAIHFIRREMDRMGEGLQIAK